MSSRAILIIRLGAMGDIIHALPAAASLKQSFSTHRLYWAIAPKWTPLLEGNPFVDHIIGVDRHSCANLKQSWQKLRSIQAERAIDFQGLIQSAVVGRIARPARLFGFEKASLREPFASYFYTDRFAPTAEHVVEKNLQLAEAAGATNLTKTPWIPPGRDESDLPSGPFVLCNPFAGWAGKQWPIENYQQLALRLVAEGLELVVNVPAQRAPELAAFKQLRVHTSSLAGLIAATHRATAVVGLDSGPLHLAAALQKPGVALFGPTDPARNGPYGGSMEVLRAPQTETTYKRDDVTHSSMRAISVDQVAETLLRSIARRQIPSERRP
jgi:lipopolysaccharide heptosyltransferase I